MALEGAGGIGWENHVYPSTARRQVCPVTATSSHPPTASPRMYQLGSMGIPNSYFLLFILYVGNGPVDNGTFS